MYLVFHSSVDRHWASCFSAIIDNAVMNIYVQIFLCVYGFSLLFGVYLSRSGVSGLCLSLEFHLLVSYMRDKTDNNTTWGYNAIFYKQTVYFSVISLSLHRCIESFFFITNSGNLQGCGLGEKRGFDGPANSPLSRSLCVELCVHVCMHSICFHQPYF